MSKSKPVYFVCYESVYRLSYKRALQFVTACVTGVGSTYALDYGKRVHRKTFYIDSDGYDSDRPAIIDWCAARGYHCYHFTDFDETCWRAALVGLQLNNPDYDIFSEGA